MRTNGLRSISRLLPLLAAAAAALAASAGNGPEVRGDGDGTVCAASGVVERRVSAFDGDYGFCPAPVVADEPLTFQVLFELGSRITEDEHATCAVELDGSTLRIRSEATWTLADGSDDGTYALVATCTTPPLPEGRYTVVNGEEEYELLVPSEPCEPCFPRAVDLDAGAPACCDGACGLPGCV